MAQLVVTKPSFPDLPVYFNVDREVGASPAANLTEDVLLVQFMFKVIGDSPQPGWPPGLLPAIKAVKVTGVIDTATVNAIRTLQSLDGPGTVADGRVSPTKGDGISYGSGFWTIAKLNNSVQRRFLDVWPRIDKIPGCPAGLKALVTRTVAGTQ